MRKVGLHFQLLPDWHVKVVDNSSIEYVKMINPSGDYPYHREVKVIGRNWLAEDGIEWLRYGYQGKDGAEQYFRDCLPRYKATPWIYAWEAINEWPPYWDQCQRYDNFASRWIELMHSEGYRTVAGSISTGQPEAKHIQLLRKTLETTDLFCLHEYAQPRMQSNEGWLCLRYRKTYEELKAAGIRQPPLLITEAGIDGGAVIPGQQAQPKKGWKTFTTKGDYLTQLEWYDAELCKDDYVVCFTPFVSGANDEWFDFDMDEELVRWMVAIPYYYQSRQGYKITHIVLHDTEGTAEAAESWFRNPNNPLQSSAHKIVTDDGNEWNIIPDNLGANHAGYGTIPGMTGINPNLFSLGLEFEYPAYPASPEYPEAQLKKAAEIVKRWAGLYQIPRTNVYLHKEIDPKRKSDPRNFDKQAFLDRVYGSVETELAEAIQKYIVPLNADAALAGAGMAKGYLPASDELYYNGYVAQAFRDSKDYSVQHIAYCKSGAWDDIKWFIRDN